MLHRPQTALPYYGGKAGLGNTGIGPFVASLLPREREIVYIETHCGMLGVLLSRRPAKCEIANDLNGRVVNFWRVIRDSGDELERLVRYTPYARSEFDHCKRTLDEGDELERARKFYVVVRMSMYHADGSSGGFAMTYTTHHGRVSLFWKRVKRLQARVERVMFDCRPAIEVLDKHQHRSDAVIYVDPPYASAGSNDTYGISRHDYDDTLRLLHAQAGRVAVSGYNDEWDDLGWMRHECPTFTTSMQSDGNRRLERVEVVWTNYIPAMQGELL